MTETESRRALPLWLIVVLGVGGGAVALWGIRGASGVLGPVLLAFVLTTVVHPLISGLVRRGAPRWLAVAVGVLVVDGGLILFAVAVLISLGQLATVLPQYSDEWQHLLDDLRSALTAVGVGPEQAEQALHSLDPKSVLAAVTGLLSGLLGATAAFVLVLATGLFMAVDAAGLSDRLAAVPGISPHLMPALGSFARTTRRYYVVSTIFGFAVAVVDTIALYLLGIPLPVLWGLLSFLTNYVPNIGFFLGLAPPTLLALLVGGPWLAVLVIVIYSLANFILQSIVQPLFVGDAVGLAVTVTFLSVIVWTVVLGPLGAVLAVPLTLFVVAVLVEQDPDRRWARVLLAGGSGAAPRPEPPPHPAPKRPSGRRPARSQPVRRSVDETAT